MATAQGDASAWRKLTCDQAFFLFVLFCFALFWFVFFFFFVCFSFFFRAKVESRRKHEEIRPYLGGGGGGWGVGGEEKTPTHVPFAPADPGNDL